MATFLIDQEYVTENTIIDGNVDYKKFRPAIRLAQDFDLLPLLGTDLLNALKVHVNAFYDSATAVPEPYKTLLETYVQPALVYFALGRATPTFKFKYAAKGVIVKGSENSQSAETIDIQRMEDIWKNNAQGYAKYMVDYLSFNPNLFPEYNQISTSTYKVFPKVDVFECPLFLGAKRNNPTIVEWYTTRHES